NVLPPTLDRVIRRKGRSFNNPPSVARGGNPKDWERIADTLLLLASISEKQKTKLNYTYI
ncbi:hypothetical protein AID10_23240, partial [Salmonella enterica subsp. houtenae]|nr:hypothetical protein [Salmonella enterica subsp. houtenae]